MEWQPIDTAPKDGSTILVAGFTEGEPVVVPGYFYWESDGWEYDHLGFWSFRGFDDAEVEDFTDWMPLPGHPLQNKERIA